MGWDIGAGQQGGWDIGASQTAVAGGATTYAWVLRLAIILLLVGL